VVEEGVRKSNSAHTWRRLVEHLMEDWYINRHEREEHLKSIVALKDAKEQARPFPPRPS
jgi:hypothetical protein